MTKIDFFFNFQKRKEQFLFGDIYLEFKNFLENNVFYLQISLL